MRKHDSIRGAENQFQEITQIKTEKNKVGEGNIDIPHPPNPRTPSPMWYPGPGYLPGSAQQIKMGCRGRGVCRGMWNRLRTLT